VYLTEDQGFVLEQIIDLVKRLRRDAVVVAGDQAGMALRSRQD
jgi:DNA repair exonuclease SbcCD nuclease subunit